MSYRVGSRWNLESGDPLRRGGSTWMPLVLLFITGQAVFYTQERSVCCENIFFVELICCPHPGKNATSSDLLITRHPAWSCFNRERCAWRSWPSKTVRTPENVGTVRQGFLQMPQCSTRKHATFLGSSDRSVKKIPCKTMALQLLFPPDFQNRSPNCQRWS